MRSRDSNPPRNQGRKGGLVWFSVLFFGGGRRLGRSAPAHQLNPLLSPACTGHQKESPDPNTRRSRGREVLPHLFKKVPGPPVLGFTLHTSDKPQKWGRNNSESSPIADDGRGGRDFARRPLPAAEGRAEKGYRWGGVGAAEENETRCPLLPSADTDFFISPGLFDSPKGESALKRSGPR